MAHKVTADEAVRIAQHAVEMWEGAEDKSRDRQKKFGWDEERRRAYVEDLRSISGGKVMYEASLLFLKQMEVLVDLASKQAGVRSVFKSGAVTITVLLYSNTYDAMVTDGEQDYIGYGGFGGNPVADEIARRVLNDVSERFPEDTVGHAYGAELETCDGVTRWKLEPVGEKENIHVRDDQEVYVGRRRGDGDSPRGGG